MIHLMNDFELVEKSLILISNPINPINPITALPRKELLARGYCCGLKCLNCPYSPPHQEGVKKIKKSA